MRTSKKLLSLILAVVMVVTSCSVGLTAFAQTNNPTIWSTNNDSDDAYAALNNLANQLPALLMGIDGISAYVADPVYEKYAKSDYGKTADQLTQQEKDAIKAKATIQDILGGLQPFLLETLAGVSQQQFVDWFETPEVSGYTGVKSPAAAYNFFVPENPSKASLFTLFTLCAAYKDDTSLPADARAELTNWFNQLGSVLMDYIAFKNQSAATQAKIEEIASRINSSLIEQPGNDNFSKHYTNATLQELQDFDFQISADEQALVDEQISNFRIQLSIQGFNIPINGFGDYVYYALGAGSKIVSGNIGTYAQLINTAGLDITLTGSYDLFGMGRDVDYNITTNLTADNYAEEIVNATVAGSGLTEKQIVETIATAKALNGSTITELQDEQAALTAAIATAETDKANAKATLYSHTKEYVDANGGTTWFTLNGSNSRDSQATAALKNDNYRLSSATAWNLYATNNSGNRTNINKQTTIWYNAQKIIDTSTVRLEEVTQAIDTYNSAAAVISGLSDEYIHSYLCLLAADIYAAIVLAGESSVTDSDNYFYIMLGAAQKYAGKSQSTIMADAKRLMPNQSDSFNLSQSDYEAMAYALAGVGSNLDPAYFTDGSTEYDGTTYYLPDAVKDTAVAEYFAMIHNERSSDTDAHRLGLYEAFNSATPSQELDNYYSEAYAYAVTKTCMEALDSTTFVFYRGTFLNERMDIDSVILRELMDAVSDLVPLDEFVPTDAEKAIINAEYDLTGDTGKELLNKLLNDTIGGALQMELMDKSVTDIINGFLETQIDDLGPVVNDLWKRVYDAPVKTIFELLPVLVVAINEIVEPIVFNNNSDDPLYSALRGGLLGDFSFDSGSYIGISRLHFDLNELLPNLMDWLLYGTYDGVTYYTQETVTFKEYDGSAFVDRVYGINDIETGDLKNYKVVDAEGNELKRNDGDPVTYSYMGMEDTDLLTVLAQNPEAEFKYYNTYEGNVPVITGIYIADKALRDAEVSDLTTILANAIGNDTVGPALGEVIAELATTFDAALHEFVDTPELKNQVKCLPNSGQVFQIESRGLNNLMVAIPELFDIMDDLAAEKYSSDKDNWTYCYAGKIVEITPTADKYNSYNSGNGLKPDDHFFRNSVLENFKSFANDTSADRSKNILEAFAQTFVGDWLNALLSLLNVAVTEDSAITQNLPIVTGLLQALGGFGEESIITDVLNGVFQLEREDAESFTFAAQPNGFTGLSVNNAYFLLANIDRLIEVITNLVGKFGNNDDSAEPRMADAAVSADGPVYFAKAKASAATSTYTKDELSNATDLINNLDKLLSSLLSDSTFNDFSLDDAGNIAAALVKFFSNYLGDDCKTEIMRYVNSYVYQILGHDNNVANDEHQMDDEVFYSNESLTNFVAETYLLIERIVELYLDKERPFGDDYTLDDGSTAHYNLIVEAIEGVISPDVVALRLSDYSDAQTKIDSYNCWHDVTDVTSRGNSQVKINWGFSDGDKSAWFKGCAASFRLISSLLGVLFVETGYYETIIGPVLEAISAPNGVTVDTAAEYGAKTNGYYDEAIIGLVRPLKDLLNKGFDKPVTTLIKSVQGIAGILDDNSGVTIASVLNGAITPLQNELNGAATVLSLTSSKLGPVSPTLATLVGALTYVLDQYKDPSNIQIGKDDTKYPLSGANLVNIINTYLADTGIQLLDIDWAKLAKAKTPAEALLRIVEYLFDVVLDNENLQALIKLIGSDGVAGQILDALKANKIKPRDLIALINKVLEITDSPTLAYWTFAQYVQEITESFVYPKGVSKKMADEAVENLDALVENLFPLLSSFGVDLGGDSLSGVLNAKAFTNANVTKLAKALYGALDGLDPTIKEVLKGLGIVTSTKDVAKLLTDKSYGATYTSAANAIKAQSSWSKVADNKVNWGFTDGSAKAQQGFTNALAAVLRPLNSVLAVFLNEGNIAIDDTLYDLICSIKVPYTVTTLDIGDAATARIAYIMYDGVLKLTVKEDPSNRSKSIASQLVLDFKALKTIDDLKIEGTNGYNSAIIPLLEALQAKDVKSYSQYQSDVKAAKDNLLLDILNPILGDNSGSILNQLYKAPVTFLTELLPNVALYLDAHGLSQLVNNLLAPVTGLIADINDVININSIVKAILGTDLDSYLGNLLGTGKINLDLSDLSSLNLEDLIVPILNNLVFPSIADGKLKDLKLPDIDWQKLINLGDIVSYTSKATGSDGYYLTGKRIESIDNGKALITVLRYVANVLIDNAQTIKNLVLGIDAVAKNDMLKAIIASIFNTIGAQTPDAIIAALFYIFAGEPQDVFWDYRDYKTGNYSFSYPETVDVDFLKQLPPMLDGLISGFLDLNGLIGENLFKDELIGKIATGLYGAVEGVKVGDNSLTSLLAQTDIDFSTANVAKLLVDKDYGQTFESAAATIRAAGSWKNVNASSLKFGVTDRDSFFHALVAVLRPLYGVLDVLLNDADLNLFNVVRLPGSNGYTSSIVPLMEAFSMYNIKTQYQYRQDIRKEYDAILLDILNPIWDLVEDVLNAPLQTIMAIVPNLALFIGNDGLCQVISNLITPIRALLDSLAPIVDANELLTQVLDGLGVNLNSILGKIGIKNLKIDLYNIDKTLEPVLGGDAIVPLINNILGIIDINGTKIDLRLNPIDWLQLASHGETVVAASQAASYDARIFVIGDSSETLIAVLRYLINTINTGDNFDALNSLIGGLIGGANDSIADVVGQVLGMLQGDTDEVISSLVDLLQTLA